MGSNNTIKHLPADLRPDEKFIRYGQEALSDAELLAIILRTGTKDEHSIALAQKILTDPAKTEIDILRICSLDYRELLAIKGVGKVKALEIKAIAELSRRIARSSAKRSLCVNSPATVAEYFMEQMRHLRTEVVFMLSLSTACEILEETLISKGGINMALLPPREIFLNALRCNAANIVLVHNHPSGEPRPSRSDIESTKAVSQLGVLLGIRLLDHVIIGDRTYYSMKEEGIINE